MSDASEKLQEALSALVPTAEPSEPADFLSVVDVASQVEREGREMLRSSVVAARDAGATWVDIGRTLGISKQAAQKRFAAPTKLPSQALDPHERLIGPVGLADEIDELNLAGRYGWHSVGFGLAHHHVVRSSTQWEHRRVMGERQVTALRSEGGWVVVGRSFPYTLLARDLGVAALVEPDEA